MKKGDGGLKNGTGGEAPAWLIRARQIVDDRYHEVMNLETVAREVGVSPARLARAFRACFRLPLGAYQQRRRVERAALSLATTDIPLARLAVEAGFCDQAHFTRHFRRHMGQTPGSFRRARRPVGRAGRGSEWVAAISSGP